MKRSVPVVPVVTVGLAAALLAGLAVVSASRGAAVAAGPSSASGRAVVVDGTGETSGRPDVLRVSLGVTTSGPDVGEALTRASRQVARIEAMLRARGVRAADVQTSTVSIYPGETRRGRRYHVSEQLTARLRDLPRAGRTISEAVAAGGAGVSLDGVVFALEDNAALLAAARKAAYADAQRKAGDYAALTGSRLGEVQLVSESVVPLGLEGHAKRGAADGAAPAVPLYPGTAQVRVSVSVRWALS